MDMHAGAKALVRFTFSGDESAWDDLQDEGKEQVYTAVNHVVQAVMGGKPPVTTDDVEKLRQNLLAARDADAAVIRYQQLNEAIGLVSRIQGRVAT